ncbi:MAG: hypothetical protein IPM16_20670 [Chloroflexi bacterium]|nr:hypothetical protein [Chloroflexota bacterium]
MRYESVTYDLLKTRQHDFMRAAEKHEAVKLARRAPGYHGVCCDIGRALVRLADRLEGRRRINGLRLWFGETMFRIGAWLEGPQAEYDDVVLNHDSRVAAH